MKHLILLFDEPASFDQTELKAKVQEKNCRNQFPEEKKKKLSCCCDDLRPLTSVSKKRRKALFFLMLLRRT